VTDRFDRARELFIAASEIEPDQREAYLDRMCGDDSELRNEVLELLRFHRQESVDDEGATPLSDQPPPSVELENIGRYRLVRKIGEGGMGQVYEAEQQRPIRRAVALKIIKWGMDTEQVVARFESERQALALMDHPNIARVYDAGATEQGRPYFVMELVQGISITDYCDRNRLDTEQRLELFLQVCRGVQHAHQKGVIHRDLKPSNILVTVSDQGPTPKIIDFGIAKATSQRLTEHTVFTELGQWIGTPEYMSPEQADLTALDIDTRTDVYSLGVVLYELLAGALPFDSVQLRASGFEEMRRIIREQDPPRPSTRVSSLGEQAPTTAEQRATDPITLARRLKGDLDWISMRALEKDRFRRYGSPSELAGDIERHLDHQPVTAGPPGMMYRARKFGRRHRAAVIAGGLVLSALVVGLVVATIGMVRAQRAERIATTQVELLIGLFDALDPGGETGGTASTEEILTTATTRINRELGHSPLVRARLLETIGRIYVNLGAHPAARRAFEESLEIRRAELGPTHPQVADSLRHMGWVLGLIGEVDAAVAHLELALEIHEQAYGPDHPSTGETLNELAFELWRDGEFSTAKPLFERALSIRERAYGPDHLSVGDTLYMQAVLLRDMGEVDRARAGFERALKIREAALGPDHTQVAWTLVNYGQLFQQTGDDQKARAHYQRALSIQQAIFGSDHFTSVQPLIGLGQLELESGDLDRARVMIEDALHIQEKLYGVDHLALADTLVALGRVEQNAGDTDRAHELYQRSLQINTRHHGDDHPALALSLGWLGDLAFWNGDYRLARDYFSRRLEILEAADGPNSQRTAHAQSSLAWALVRLGETTAANRLYHEAIESGGLQLTPSPATNARQFYNHACLAALVGEPADAIRWSQRAVDLGQDPRQLMNDPDLASIHGDPRFQGLVSAARPP
jgi:tetratricopeptide (TPR) repeat protein